MSGGEDKNEGLYGSRQRERKDKPLSFAVVAGCGRLGSLLADGFSAEGLDVIVIDSSPESFKLLSEGFSGFTITGTAAEYGTLERARLTEADLFLQ